jgi:phosphoesterase RecJ-like protein
MHHIREKIDTAEHIVLMTHVNPDADSMGSASAFYSYLLQLQKKVTLFSPTHTYDKKLHCIPWVDKLKHQIPSHCDLAISFDCGSRKRLGVVFEKALINFDHHKSNEAYGDLNCIDESAISTTQVVYDYFIAEGVKINPKMATALYAGLVDDSQNFQSDKTDGRAFEMAQVLLSKGADKERVIKHLFQTSPLSLLRLKGMMLTNMQLEAEGLIVVHKVTQEMFAATGAHYADCENALEESLFLPTVSVALMLCELSDGSIKGSLRSDGTLDACAVAERYEGGGHAHAAGFVCRETSLDEASQKLIKDILEKKK